MEADLVGIGKMQGLMQETFVELVPWPWPAVGLGWQGQENTAQLDYNEEGVALAGPPLNIC